MPDELSIDESGPVCVRACENGLSRKTGFLYLRQFLLRQGPLAYFLVLLPHELNLHNFCEGQQLGFKKLDPEEELN